MTDETEIPEVKLDDVVRLLQLSTGHLVVGMVINSNSSYIDLQSALIITFQENDEGTIEGYSLRPYLGIMVDYETSILTRFMSSQVVSVNLPARKLFTHYIAYLQYALNEQDKPSGSNSESKDEELYQDFDKIEGTERHSKYLH